MKRSFPDRSFKVWDFSVSHQQMVIRSLGPQEGSPNLDLHFRGVEYLRIPVVLNGLSIEEPTESETAEVRNVLSSRQAANSTLWVLVSSGQRYLVAASHLEISENLYPMMSTALIHPSPEGGTL